MMNEKTKKALMRSAAIVLTLVFCLALTAGCSAGVENAEITVSFGDEQTIELQKTYASLRWQSADTSIAAVNDNGVVTGMSVGTTAVTATEGEKIVANVQVTVAQSEMEMTVDYAAETKVAIPDAVGSLEWKSADETIATVDASGVVKGVGPGSTEISAMKDGNLAAKVIVTVNVVEPTAIFLSMENMEIEIDSLAPLSYMLMPDNASGYGITWKSTNPAVATVDETGMVQGITDGTVTIICSTPNGQLATCNVTVKPKSAIEQLNEAEKALFDGLINDILPSFYNASAFRIRKLYYASSSGSNTFLYVDIQGTNRLGGTLYQTGTIFKSTTEDTWYYLKMDTITKDYPVPTETMDYTKINAALEEYWSGSIH